MSIDLMARARKVRKLDPTAKLILMFLADHADQNGRCWPSVQLLAEDVGVSIRSVQKHMNGLLEKGLVSRQLRTARTSLYTLHIPHHVTGDTIPSDADDGVSTFPPDPVAEDAYPVTDDGLTIKEPSGDPYQEENTYSEVEVEGRVVASALGEIMAEAVEAVEERASPDRAEIEEAVRKLAAAGLMDEAAAMAEVEAQLAGGEPAAEPEPEPADGGGTLRDQLPSGFAKDQAEFDAKVDSGERPEGWSDDGDQGRWV